jgi:hypothetical protein
LLSSLYFSSDTFSTLGFILFLVVLGINLGHAGFNPQHWKKEKKQRQE